MVAEVGAAFFYSNYIAAVLAVLLKEGGGEIVVTAADVEMFLDHPVTLSITKRGDEVVITFSHSDLPDGQVH